MLSNVKVRCFASKEGYIDGSLCQDDKTKSKFI